MDQMQGYNPIRDLQNAENELRQRSDIITVDETKVMLKGVEISVRKAINCAKRGIYYRHWCGFVSYLNQVYESIDDMIKHTDKITYALVEEVYRHAVSGVTAFSVFVKENYSVVKEVLDMIEPVFKNTVLALTQFGKFVKEGMKSLIEEGIKKVKEIWLETIKFLKENVGGIFISVLACTSSAAIARALSCTGAGAKSVVVGAGMGMLEHCLIGGGVGLGVGLFIGLAKEGIFYLRDRKKNKKIKNLMFSPEVDAEEAERRGLVEINEQVGRLIKLVTKIANKKEAGHNDYALQYSRIRGNLLVMQREIPKVPNTSLEFDNQESE